MKNSPQTGKPILKEEDFSEIIQMAWCDKTPFEAIQKEFGLSETDVIRVMREQLKPSSFRMWRKRVSGRSAKHEKRTVS